MRTLLEKLKPEVLVLLEKEALEYPATMEVLKETLGKLHFWVELKVSDASRLVALKPRSSFNIETLSNLFEE